MIPHGESLQYMYTLIESKLLGVGVDEEGQMMMMEGGRHNSEKEKKML